MGLSALSGRSPGPHPGSVAHRPSGASRLVALTREECLELLSTQSVGRVGVTVQALPVVLPVNFGLLDESVVFRTIPGTKFDAAASGTVVAFEVDDYEPNGWWGWSVLVIGRASRMLADEVDKAEALGIDAWPLDAQTSNFVRIDVSQITGRQFDRTSQSDVG